MASPFLLSSSTYEASLLSRRITATIVYLFSTPFLPTSCITFHTPIFAFSVSCIEDFVNDSNRLTEGVSQTLEGNTKFPPSSRPLVLLLLLHPLLLLYLLLSETQHSISISHFLIMWYLLDFCLVYSKSIWRFLSNSIINVNETCIREWWSVLSQVQNNEKETFYFCFRKSGTELLLYSYIETSVKSCWG